LIRKSSESKGSSSVKKWREMASLITNRTISFKIRGSVYESSVRSVMLYGAKTWALTGKLEDILKSCYSRMLRYTVGVRWQDRSPVKR